MLAIVLVAKHHLIIVFVFYLIALPRNKWQAASSLSGTPRPSLISQQHNWIKDKDNNEQLFKSVYGGE